MRKVSYTLEIFTSYLNKIQVLCYLLSLFFCLVGNTLFAQTKIEDNVIAKSFRDLPIDSSFAWMNKYAATYDDTYRAFGHKVGLQTLSMAYLTKENSLIAEAHARLRDWHDNKVFSHDSVLYYSEKAVEYYNKTESQRKIALHNTLLAHDYRNIDEGKKAQDALFRALEIYEALEDESGMARVYQILSMFSVDLEEPEQSIKYADKAMVLFDKTDDYIGMALTYLRYIKSYIMLGKYDKAYQAATDCIELTETKVPAEAVELSYTGRDIGGRAYSFRGDIYIIWQDYEKALADYTKTWTMSVEDYGEEISAGWRAEMGIACRHLGRYEEAIEHHLASNKLVEELGGYRMAKDYLETAKSYEQMGNTKEALVYQKKFMIEKEKEQKEKIASLETEALVKYETGKKDQLLTAQEEQLAQKNKIQNLTLGIVALLAGLLFALFTILERIKKSIPNSISKTRRTNSC